MATIYALFAVKVGDEDWQEQLITEQPSKSAAAKQWAQANGFDRFREVRFDDTERPDFIKTLNR